MSEENGQPSGEEDVYDALFTEPEPEQSGIAEVGTDPSERVTAKLESVSGEPSDGAGPGAPADEVTELRLALEAAKAEAAEARERLLRKAADLENARKRHARDREETLKYGAEGVLREVVTALDDLERALVHAKGAGQDGALVEGVDMVVRKFQQAISRVGCVGFESVGHPFDPNRHDAIQQVEDASVPNNTVVREFQRGYFLHERLLRPAMVVVARGGGDGPPAEKVDDAGADGMSDDEDLASGASGGDDS
ncbi:MAG: nucleotide exchange factor GrpE [Deltaproteobacteria bacterium]|nr:MAG: nucleotide exchange factor GrpE [Deltaproteobacteria bacterium]